MSGKNKKCLYSNQVHEQYGRMLLYENWYVDMLYIHLQLLCSFVCAVTNLYDIFVRWAIILIAPICLPKMDRQSHQHILQGRETSYRSTKSLEALISLLTL